MEQENFSECTCVSIIIPVYNGEKYLARCIESCLGQSYRNLDIILVNDGSTDSTLSICEQYRKADARIRVVSEENKGLSGARNTGLSLVRGEYVYFLDCDDFIESELMEKTVKVMQDDACDLAAFSLETFYESTPEKEPWLLDERKILLDTDYKRFYFVAAEYMTCGIRFEVWNKLFRRSIIEEHHLRFEDNRKIFAEDICFLAYYLAYTRKICIMRDVLYHYMIRPTSLTGSAYTENTLKLTQFVCLAEMIWKFYRDNCKNSRLYRNYEYIYAALMHDQYKRVNILQLPRAVDAASSSRFFNYMTEKAYRSRFYFIRLFGLRLGDLLLDESFAVRNRNRKSIVYLTGCLVNVKRVGRTLLKRMYQGKISYE